MIKGGTYQVGHSGVNDAEQLVHAFLHVQHFRYQASHLRDDGTSELKVDLLAWTQTKTVGEGLEIRLEVWNGVLLRVILIDSESATHVYVFHLDAFRRQDVLKLVYTQAQLFKVVHVENLAADMEVQAREIDVFQT